MGVCVHLHAWAHASVHAGMYACAGCHTGVFAVWSSTIIQHVLLHQIKFGPC